MAIASVSTAAMEFINQGYAIVPFSQGERLIAPVIDGFLNFLKEPVEYRNQWTFNIGNRVDKDGKPDPDDGYIRRDGENGHDKKCFFHFRPRLIAALDQKGVDIRDHAQWIGAMGALYYVCDRAIRSFNLELSEYLPECGIAERISEHAACMEAVLRLLFYDLTGADPSKPEVIAKPHTDKDFTTLHVKESHPGLCYGPESLLWESKPGESLVFPGKKFKNLMKDCYPERHFPALKHWVVNNGRIENRWSIVFFSHIKYDDSE